MPLSQRTCSGSGLSWPSPRPHGPAEELLHEETGGPCHGVRTDERDRLNRTSLHDVGNADIAGGTVANPARYDACATQRDPKCLTAITTLKAALRFGSPMGQRKAAHKDVGSGCKSDSRPGNFGRGELLTIVRQPTRGRSRRRLKGRGDTAQTPLFVQEIRGVPVLLQG